MRTGDRVHTVVDQPARQLALPVIHLHSVLISPMHESQDEPGALAGLGDHGRHALAIFCPRQRNSGTAVVDVGQRNHRRFRPDARRKKVGSVGARDRFAGPDHRDVVRLQPRDRIQQCVAPEIVRVIVRQADRVDSRRSQSPDRVEWRAQGITFAGDGVPLVGKNALQVHQFH